MGVQREGGVFNGGTNLGAGSQGGGIYVRTRDVSADLGMEPGQVEVPAYSGSCVSAHVFYKRGTTTMFDIRIVIFNAGYYL